MPYIYLNPSGYKTPKDMHNLINYILNEEKDVLTGGNILFNSPDAAYNKMMLVKKNYRKTDGRLMRHLIFSPSDDENRFFSEEDLYDIAIQICMLFEGYQAIFTIHRNTGRNHIHIAINTVSYIDGKKININLYRLKNTINKIVGCHVEIKEPTLNTGCSPQRTHVSLDDMLSS